MEQSKKFSLDAQEGELRQFAEDHDYAIHEVYRDQCSGMSWQGQKELARLVEDAEHKAFDTVLVTERDRLTRDPDGASILKYIFAKNGIRLIVLSEPEHRTKNPTEELIDGIISLIARYESEIRLVRVRRGMALAVESGKHPGKAPYGYSNTPAGLVPSEKAEQVQRIFERYAAGESMYALSRATGFNPSKVHYILNNPVYIGKIRWRDKLLPGQHSPIISSDLWRRVRQRKL